MPRASSPGLILNGTEVEATVSAALERIEEYVQGHGWGEAFEEDCASITFTLRGRQTDCAYRMTFVAMTDEAWV